MFSKSNMRPAFAAANAGVQSSRNAVKNDAFMYDAGTSETDDFGSFSSGAPAANGAGNQKRPKKAPKKPSSFKPAAIAVAAAAVVAVILLVVVAVALIGGNGKDIKFANNVFVSYEDSDGIWRVAANGEVLDDYEGEVELRVAADRSFAYIIESVDEGNGVVVKNVYYTDGKTTTTVAESISDVLATATLKPGVIWLDEVNGVYLFTEAKGEEKLVRKQELDATISPYTTKLNFCISADASTVAYNKFNDSNGKYRLCVYRDGNVDTSYQSNHFVTALSNDGSLIYTYRKTNDGLSQQLSVHLYNENNKKSVGPAFLSDNFVAILGTNVAGDELLVATMADGKSGTSIITFNPKKLEDAPIDIKIDKDRICLPKSDDPDVACFATYADKYFASQLSIDLTDRTAPVYYLDKNFEKSTVAKYSGEFSSDGDYFYYIDNNNHLMQTDLTSKDMTKTDIGPEDGVIDFEVTQKGNIYYLSQDKILMYYELSKDTARRVDMDVDSISIYTYSNTLYYTMIDGTSVYCTEESTKRDVADISGATSVPYFANPNSRKTFLICYDAESEELNLMYTSNGKKFKTIGACKDISGFDLPVFDIDIPEADPNPGAAEGDSTGAQG